MDKLHYSLFLLIGLSLFLGAFALATVQSSFDKDPQVQANESNILWLLNHTKFQLETDKSIMKAMVKQSNSIVELKDYDDIITTQIGNIRSDIISKFPQASDVIDEEKSSKSDTPFLTLKMEKTDYVLGNVVFFMGTAQPNDPVFITLKDSSRSLWQIPISSSMIIDGSYMTNYTIRLDDPVGVWQVYARQLSDQTKTLTFKVE